jgi:hypothetical protein
MLFASILVAIVRMSSGVLADDHLHGVILGRVDVNTIRVQTDDAASVNVVVNNSTKVSRGDSSTALMPWLRIKADGHYDSPTHFVAERVSFSSSDLKRARSIQGGVYEAFLEAVRISTSPASRVPAAGAKP